MIWFAALGLVYALVVWFTLAVCAAAKDPYEHDIEAWEAQFAVGREL